MRIGIDLRPLQNGHKYRGIGEVAKQVTDRILQRGVRDNVEFVFFENSDTDPRELLDVPEGITYSTVNLGPMPEVPDNHFTKKQKARRAYQELFGHPITGSGEVDVFLQYDYTAGVPTNTKTLLIKHDLIPYLFWSKYFESAWVPFRNKAARSTLRTLFANYKFMRLLRRGLRNAHTIVTVSHSTKDDLRKYFDVSDSKMSVAHLGVDRKPSKTSGTERRGDMPTKPYLLFVGAGDARRRVDDAVVAFNNLRAKGHDIQLVLAGENFKSPDRIPNTVVRNEVVKSSYTRDILTLGYIDDTTKQELFEGAIAYVYPTKYEGFGIPILEAMLMDCPVVVYKNSSTYEVGGEFALYANGWEDIVKKVETILGWSEKEKKSHNAAARVHAEEFTWDKTAEVIYSELKEIVDGKK